MNEISNFHDHVAHMDTIDVAQLGSSLVVAPHPDDETLGCGGTVALMHKQGIAVHFLFISDGSMSHPNSKQFPSEKLRDLREQEARKAVQILVGNTDHINFFRLKDSLVPDKNSALFSETVERVTRLINQVRPETIFVPWQQDPHRDHRATWEILSEAVKNATAKPRFLEYPIWFWELGKREDLELIGQMKKLAVAIDETLEIKNKALAAHVSQVTHLIDDDPEGFMLSAEVIAHFNTPRELFFESAS